MFKGTGWQHDGKFCLNDQPLDRVTLGHVTWSFLHTTAAYLPETLNATTKQAFQNLIMSVKEIYACELCRGHFQEQMRDTMLQRELHDIKSREDAVLFLWKVHNMVTAAQYPNAPLFVSGVTSTQFPVQNQTYTLKGGQRLYNDDGLPKAEIGPYKKLFEAGQEELPLGEMTDLFKAEVYDGTMKRWRAAGGLVPVPSLYAAQPMSKQEIKGWDKFVAEIDNVPPMAANVCSNVTKELHAANTSVKRAACPTAASGGGKLEVTFFTMGRCPFCAQTMESLKPLIKGAFGDKVTIRDRYILMPVRQPPRSLNDFSSLHGPGEVVADAYELCAQQHYPEEWLDFVWCIDKQYYAAGTENSSAVCARQLGWDFSKLKGCAWGAEGLRMVTASAELSRHLNITGAPSIVIDGKLVVSGGLQYEGLASLFCTKLACRELSQELYPSSAVKSTEMLAVEQEMAPEEYLEALGQQPDDFAQPTALYSDTQQSAYGNLLQGMLEDGVVTPTERKMLAQTRLALGITQQDHASAVARRSLIVADRTVEPGAVPDHTGSWLSMLGMLALIAVVFGGAFLTWRKIHARAPETVMIPIAVSKNTPVYGGPVHCI